MRLRFAGAYALFALFLAVAAYTVWSGRLMDDEMILLWGVPLIGAVLVLPRSTSTPLPVAESDEDEARIEMVRQELGTMNSRALFSRMGFFAVVFAMVFLNFVR